MLTWVDLDADGEAVDENVTASESAPVSSSTSPRGAAGPTPPDPVDPPADPLDPPADPPAAPTIVEPTAPASLPNGPPRVSPTAANAACRYDTARRLLWCMTHRASGLLRPTFVTTHPRGVALPNLAPAPFGVLDRREAAGFARTLTRDVMRAATLTGLRMLTPSDIVYPSGEFLRDGPCLWARLEGNDWMLAEIDLWPQLRADGCPRLLDLFCCLGVTTFLEDTRVLDGAARTLGANRYPGISPCSAW